jgi:hypothetical protein
MNGGNLLIAAQDEVAAAAGLAEKAVASVPAYTHALANLPLGNARADGIYSAGDLMSRHTGILDTGPISLFH